MEYPHKKTIDLINSLSDTIHTTAVDKGWWDNDRKFPECVALMHSELSEALEEYRDGRFSWLGPDGKPEGIIAELADCMIRILDVCSHHQWNIGKVMIDKMEYNKTRAYKHGGKEC